MPAYLTILLQISLSLLLFWSAYVLFIRRIHQFPMQRAYLTASLVMSILIPVSVATLDSANPIPPGWQHWFTQTLSAEVGAEVDATAMEVNTMKPLSFWWILAGIYLCGVGLRIFFILRELVTIRQLFISANKQKREGYTLLFEDSIRQPFSFFRYIFLSSKMASDQLHYTIAHESAHVNGYHSWDNLLFEIARTFLWFHPCMHGYKRYLSEVHEYLADQQVISQSVSRKSYAHFLLENATHTEGQHLMLGLSNKLITKRILMLSKPSIRPITYVYILLLLPLGLLAFSACSMLENEPQEESDMVEISAEESALHEHEGKIIRQITWEGNAVYTDDELTDALGIHPGEIFDPTRVTQSLQYRPDGGDVSSLYMDKGHLFFTVTSDVLEVDAERVDLIFSLNEGETMEIGLIRMEAPEGLNMSVTDLKIRTGKIFSRSALIESVDQLKEAYGDMEVTVTPKPDPESGKVDIDFLITPKDSK